MNDMKESYKNNPIKFAQDFLGVELTSFQKLLLNVESIPRLIVVPRRCGYKHYIDMLNEIKEYLLEVN